ncbi:DUF4245 family protein [Brachybacterium avium]|nr:DUF4245 family protein [Brachybacterium avium]
MHDADHETSEAPQRTPAALSEQPAPSPVEPEPQLVEPAPQPKSAYELPSRKNTVLRNMVWALVLTMAVVVVVGIAFFGVGSDAEREPLANSELDVAASAERASGVAPFPVAVPAVDEGWAERSARYTAGANPRWTIEYSSPEGQLVTLVEESELGAPMLSSAIPGSAVEEEFQLEGAACSLLRGGEQGSTEHGIACEGEEWGFVVHGDADRSALEQFARAAIVSLG